MSRLAERTLAERAERRFIEAARTLVVGPTGYATISEAVAAVRDGDTVLVRPGRYRESVTVEGKTITIRGEGDRDLIVVDGPDLPAFHLIETSTTLENLTISGGSEDAWESVRVTGGNAHLDRLRITEGWGVSFKHCATGSITRSLLDHGHGITVSDRACPRIEANEIWGATDLGLSIAGDGCNPLVRGNRIHDGQDCGIFVLAGACPSIEENEIWGNAWTGISIYQTGSAPLVRGNRIYNGQREGIRVQEGACPSIEENEIWGNAKNGLNIDGNGSNPVVRGNRVHDGQDCGILVEGGACPRIEEYDIWSNVSAGLYIGDTGTDPLVRANRIHDSEGFGIFVSEGACPRVEENEIWGNSAGDINTDACAPCEGGCGRPVDSLDGWCMECWPDSDRPVPWSKRNFPGS